MGLKNVDPVIEQNTQDSELSTTPKESMPPLEVSEIISNTPTEQDPSRYVAVSEDFSKGPTEQDPLAHVAVSEMFDKSPPKQDVLLPQPVSQRPLSQFQDVSPKRREELELPPTPTQRGLLDPIVTTPPTGIHDTPSRRARRSKALAEKLKSSPLKSRDPAPAEPAKEVDPKAQEKLKAEKPPKRRKSARFLIPEDSYASKKKERDDLLQELQQLQADVALANAENERLRLLSESRRAGPPAANSDELISMLVRATTSESARQPSKQTSIFKSIGSFLPFHSGRRKSKAAMLSNRPIPSHLPIAVNDPFPYLQAFSPLTYTSTITILPSDPPSSESSQDLERPIRQKHVIHASHPSGLFATRFSMTVDTSALCITNLDILRLDMNAETELGTFIRDRARRDGPLGKDVTTICWAMGRWIEVSIQRARFWCAVEQEFGSAQARSKSLAKSRKKRKRQDSVIDDNNVDANEVLEATKYTWTRRQLLPQIGRTNMELVNEQVEVRFEWKISFDWTGEVDSCIIAVARLPKDCESIPLFLHCKGLMIFRARCR